MRESMKSFGVFHSSSTMTPQLADLLEQLGFGAIWLGMAEGNLRHAELLIESTDSITIATGIVNIWPYPADEVAQSFHRVEGAHPDRLMLGIGVGHPEAVGAQYARPYTALVEYLDQLDEEGVPTERRMLAALGPKVLALAAKRSAGAHPYLTTPQHTQRARSILGDGPLLCPEHKVVLRSDPITARALGRPIVHRPYLGLRNYTNNLRTLGYGEEDLADGGSDRLIDDLVIHGTDAQIADRLAEHLDAGADHVAIHLISDPDASVAQEYERLAAALGLI